MSFPRLQMWQAWRENLITEHRFPDEIACTKRALFPNWLQKVLKKDKLKA